MPTLTDAQKVVLATEAANQAATADSYTAQVANQDAKIAEKKAIDDATKVVFEYYNDGIIGNYDAERKSLGGDYLSSPIVEADIDACAQLDQDNRLMQNPAVAGVITLVRIDEFDGDTVINTTTNEEEHISDQAGYESTMSSSFTNTERDTKTTSDPGQQTSFNNLLSLIELQVNNRIARLDEQITALTANEDPDLDASALTDANTSKSFLEAWLVTSDVSDTGLSSLSSERGTRGAEITARKAAIILAYTDQTEDYYEKRYELANVRANTMTGTLRIYYHEVGVKTTMERYASEAQSAADALGALT